jgi:hypothetical protein
MRAMRKVLYLSGCDFSKERANMMGLMADRFAWNEPEKHISDVINK